MKLGIVGCGNMGRALVRAIVKRSHIGRKNIFLSDKVKRRMRSLSLRFKVNSTGSNAELFKKCDVVILAVKPQDLAAALGDAACYLEKKLLISICAGISTRRLEDYLGKVAVIRVMPNIPAQIGQGISAIALGRYAGSADKKLAVSIFSSIGEVLEVKEALMAAVTAISGSGPAYFFYLAEILIAAAQQLGLALPVAKRLVLKTALGSAILLNQTKQTLRLLRKQVTSKGGTTQAAFELFRKKGLEDILRRGFSAAAKRAKQLERKNR